MSVGMSLDPLSITKNVSLIVIATVALLVIKTSLVTGISMAMGAPFPVAIRSGFLLSQAGEFGFVLFSLAAGEGLLEPGLLDTLIAIIVISMAVTPAMVWAGNKIAGKFKTIVFGEIYGPIAAENNPVLIAGFGRVGETVANMLEAVNLHYIAIDADADCVARARRLGHHVFFGRAGRPDVLRSVGAEHARLIFVTLDDPDTAEGVVRKARLLYPNI